MAIGEEDMLALRLEMGPQARAYHTKKRKLVQYASTAAATQDLTVLQLADKTNLTYHTTYIHQKENGMLLYIGCHRALDDVFSPGWIYIPSDLEIFISTKRADCQGRQDHHQASGVFRARKRPKVEAYLWHNGGLLRYLYAGASFA
ncbi:MAG: hypothetical protein LQ343_006157 [Gyalolechia ehrenbergii]|nr:MAG: hypothetical protein LQ343_006157 [Gyalolechia ehrenbergii]